PLWNPFQFCGQPFFANPQYAILYPLSSLFFILPFDIAFNSIIIIHFFLGGLFIYLLLRDLGSGPAGALIAGLSFMLSGYLLSIHSLLPTLLTVVWTPLIILFFRRALLNPGLKNELITAVFMTVSFLGGGLENVYGNIIILLLMVLFYAGRRQSIIRRTGSMLLVMTVFVLLSAVQLIPFLELFYHSIRGSGLSFMEATIWSFAPRDALLFFLHDAYGYFLNMDKYWANQCWIKTLYTGSLPFVLCTLFFFLGTGRRFYVALMAAALFLALGCYNPLYQLLYTYVPIFNGLRYPVKFLYIFILALCITAGLGFERLKDYAQHGLRRHSLTTSFLICSVLSGIMLLVMVFSHEEIEGLLRLWGFDAPAYNYIAVNLHHAKRFLFYTMMFLFVLWAGCADQWKKWVQCLLILLLAADLFGIMGFYSVDKASNYFSKTKIADIITRDSTPFRTFTTGKTVDNNTTVQVPYQFVNADVSKEKHLPPYNLLYRQHDMWGIDVIRLQRPSELYAALISSKSLAATNLIDLYGGDKEELIKKNTIKLYRHRNPPPRARLLSNFKVLEAQAMLNALSAQSFHPDTEVFLEELPQWSKESVTKKTGQGGVGEKVALKYESNNRVYFRVAATRDTLLVLSDTWYPGWKAFAYPVRNNQADEKRAQQKKILRADYAFRAIALEPGEYEVRFVYDPVSFKAGMAVSILAALGIAWLLFINKKRRPAAF
ncbi:MAG: hypothetical protein NTV89_16500, partial [Proteobacteria bacterium]|nr:hypothetical protein [Pseudomonadota bacterium]